MLKKFLTTFDLLLAVALFPLVVLIFLIRSLFVQKTQKELIVRPGGMGDLILLTMAIELYGKSRLKDYVFLIEPRSEVWAKYLQLDYALYTDPSILWKLPQFKKIYNSEQRYGLSNIFALMFGKNLKGFSSNKTSFLGEVVPYEPWHEHEISCFSRLIFDRNVAHFSVLPMNNSSLHKAFFYGGAASEQRRLKPVVWSQIIAQWSCGDEIQGIASPLESEHLHEIMHSMGSGISEKSFKNFSDLMSFLKTCSSVLTIDSGALHICSYLGVKTDVVFTSSNSIKWGPLAPGSRIFKRTLSCQPCIVYGQEIKCPYGLICKKLDEANWLDVFKES